MFLTKRASAVLSPVHPPLGTLIDGHSLELVEVLGVGGYGAVYRAVNTDPLSLTDHLKSYAVKCLISSPNASSRQRHVHIREIVLHQLASVHPGVVTFHRVIEHQNAIYIIMDYAPDHDLFSQILRNCRYLGNDDLVKHIFLQLLDAVEYCHLLGIYHRDLKPENVLCFDRGLRVAITDFGLATTEKMSDEFRTGSVRHMSPECQGSEFAPDGYYSPQANDVWSLGIILLNLATGRHPWKSATVTDPTFQAYLHDPQPFLPKVLPISNSTNELLLRMLDVNWRTRMTLPEVCRAIKLIDTFYCDGVVFEGSMARCPWEARTELDSEEVANDADERAVNEWRKNASVYSVDKGNSSSSEEDYGATEDSRAIAASLAGIPPQSRKLALAAVTPTSEWSADSDTSQIIFASNSHTLSMGVPWTDFTSSKMTWGYESSMSSICQPTAYGYLSDIEFPFDSIDPSIHRYPSIDISEGEDIKYKISAIERSTDDASVTKIKPGLKLDKHLDVLRDGTSIASASLEALQTAQEFTLPIDLATLDDANRAIEKYLKDQFSVIRSKRGLVPTWPGPEIMEELVFKSSGLFIFAVAAMRLIGDEDYSAESQLDIVRKLKPHGSISPSPLLDELYLEILKQAPDQKFLKTFLALLIGRTFINENDLHEDDAMLMSVSEQELHLKLRRTHALLKFEPFIDVHHKSFLDFLQDPSRSGQYHVTKQGATRRYVELAVNSVVQNVSRVIKDPDHHGNSHFVPKFVSLFKPTSIAILLPSQDWEEILHPVERAHYDLRKKFNSGYCDQCRLFQVTDNLLSHLNSLHERASSQRDFNMNFGRLSFGPAAVVGLLLTALAQR